MVRVQLYIKADLDNVQRIIAPPGHRWYFDVKQSDGDEKRENVDVCETDEFPITNSRGHANFLVKFEGSNHQSSICVIRDKQIRDYRADDSGQEVPFAAFECRGVEPCEWYPRGGYTIVSEKGTVFEDIEFDNKDWVGYCEKSKSSVGVYDLSWQLKAVKKIK